MAEDERAECPNNVQLFRIAILNSMRNIAESVSENDFHEIFKTLKSNVIHKLYKTMVKELYTGMNNDLDYLLEEGSLQNGMAKLAGFLDQATMPITEKAWRPPGDVSLHMRSLDAHVIREMTDDLQRRVTELERENESLMNTIEENRLRIDALADNLTRVLNHAPDTQQRMQATCDRLLMFLESIEDD